MVAEKFQIYRVKITASTFVNQKIESAHFYSFPQAKLSPQIFIITTPGRRKLHIFPNTKCSENLLFPNGEGEDYGAENMTKIKLARVLVTSSDKFHHL